jgi:hypothetical protein
MVMIATVASPSFACCRGAGSPVAPAASYNPDIYHLEPTNTVMDLTVARAPFRGYQMRRAVSLWMIVCGMPKVRVGGDFWPAALKDEGWRYVIALAATVAAIGSNQDQPKGN